MREQAPLKSRTKRIGRIKPRADRISIDRIIFLPADLAVMFSAVQNFRLDLAKGYLTSIDEWADVCSDYYQEARSHLTQDHCNMYPGENDESWIHIDKKAKLGTPTERALLLAQIFDEIFARNDPELLDSDRYPTAANCTTKDHIDHFAFVWLTLDYVH